MPTPVSKNIIFAAILSGLALAASGCRGEISTQPPIHIVQNMDFQEKLKAQSRSGFPGWKDHRGMRLPVQGTVARDRLGLHLGDLAMEGKIPPDVAEKSHAEWLKSEGRDPELAKLRTYKNPDGSYVTTNPLPATREVLARGKERYEIHCAVCHGKNGRGMGIVGRKFAVKPPSFVPRPSDNLPGTTYKDALFEYADGRFFDVITTGGGTTMQPYRFQVDVKDRWAIIHYIRALQYRAYH